MEALGHRAWVRSALAADALRRRLERDRRATLRVRGHSMWPVLPAGARVALRPATRDRDLRGALVAIESGGVVVVHRAIGVAGGRVRTRGICRAHEDPPRPRDALIGIVSARLDGPWPLRHERVLRACAGAAAALHDLGRRLRRRP